MDDEPPGGDVDTAMLLDRAAAAPVGYVSVCGVELRVRAGGDPAAAMTGASPLIQTPTVNANLISLALALCGVRACAHCIALPADRSAVCGGPWIPSETWNATRRRDL